MGSSFGTVKGSKVYAAVDIGTINTGYAVSLSKNPSDIRTGYFESTEQDRVPTVILLNGDTTFNSFGYEAQRKYHSMPQEDKNRHLYFQLFKMQLYNDKKLTYDGRIFDIKNREIEASKLFTILFSHLKDLGEKSLTSNTLGLVNKGILWIFTIPAVWSDSARQFIRTAAIKAGIDKNNIKLVLEPEAAALFCRDKLRKELNSAGGTRDLPIGVKYVLADLGGGTADICAHEITVGGKLRELYKVTGDTYGGHTINAAFEGVILSIVGPETWKQFISEHTSMYLSMMKDFEDVKRNFDSNSSSVVVRVEAVFLKIVKTKNEKTFEQLINETEFKDRLTFNEENHRLNISKALMEVFFKTSEDGILKLLDDTILTTGPVQYILLAGGFSESVYIRQRIKEHFKHSKIVQERDPKHCVAKGGVMMAYQDKDIVERKIRYTYYVNTTDAEGCTDQTIRTPRFSEPQILLHSGQIVHLNQQFKSRQIEMNMKGKNESAIVFKFYRTDLQDPTVCRVQDVVGKITVPPPPGLWPERFSVVCLLKIGDNDMSVSLKVFDGINIAVLPAVLDFLETG